MIKMNLCPKCGGAISYDADKKKVVCRYCGFEEEHGAGAAAGFAGAAGTPLGDYHGVEAASFDANAEAAAGSAAGIGGVYDGAGSGTGDTAGDSWGGELKSQTCNSCGAEILYDPKNIAGRCPFCHNTYTEVPKMGKALAPSGIIPFDINENGVTEALRFPILNNVLVPKAFKAECKPENMDAVYMPVWVFNAHAKAHFVAMYGDNEKKLKNRTEGDFEHDYEEFPCAASKEYPYDLSGQASFLNIKANVPFRFELMAGYPAERYSVSAADAWKKVQGIMGEAMKADIAERAISHFNCKYCRVESIILQFSDVSYKYIYMPVWINRIDYKGKTYPTLVSGQTGAFSGDFPAIIGDQHWR
ncbi:MAG: hypothetical protein Q4E57_06010 [Eubacteriales bacterium]|nr:hypothetical protein [Eubacteriales bacterium]